MNGARPFAYWAWGMAWIWLGSLILIGGGFVVGFFMPFSPKYRSLNYVDVLRILQEILNNYLPYLGIIFGAYAYSRKHNAWQNVLIESRYPKLIMALSLFFNSLVLVVLTGHFLVKGSNWEVFLDFLRVLNTGFAFFVAWFLTEFFDRGRDNPGQPPAP
jgi:hypothetical protein